MTLTIAGDLDLDIKEKVLSQGKHKRNMNALLLTIIKLWPMLQFYVDRETKTDRAKTIWL